MAAGFHLIIEPASGGRFEHHLPAGTYTVGQEADACDIAIPSPEISRLHARLTLDRSGFVIEDLGSTLGIFANGQPVSGQQSFIIPCELYLGTMRLQIFAEGADANNTMPMGTRKVLNAAATPILTHSSIQSPKDHSGTAFGHYTRGKEIARGGMGAILEANDQVLGRTVAMKVVLEDRVSADLRQRFVREATVLARLEHPNIVPIHELGKDGEGNLFYTMKKVEGRTLQAVLEAIRKGDQATVRHYTLDRLLTIFCKVCDALAFAHSRRVIHRDLKPENIMVGAFGEVLVMDWGLAKVLDDAEQNAAESVRMAEALKGSRHAAVGSSPVSGMDELSNSELHDQKTGQLTLDGTIMGSPFYMSPEQADGRIADTDDRSDIYSLGGILYAILTLRPPVTGKKIQDVLTNVRSGNITPPTDFNPGGSSAQTAKASGNPKQPSRVAVRLDHCPGGHIPPALSSVAMKALATEPAGRYPEVLSLAADIGAHQGGFATSAENAGALTLVRLFLHRHKIIAAAASLIVLLTVGFMAKVISSEQLAVRNAKSAKAEAARATRAEAVAVEKEAATRKALARSALSLAEAALREGNGPAMRDALDTVPEELRDSTWRYLLSQTDTSIARIGVGEAIQGVVAHPRLPGVFAVVDMKGRVAILNVRTGERLLEFAAGLPTGGYNFKVAISPDGERIAVGHVAPAGGIVIHNARDGKKTIAWEAKPSGQLEFSPDGRSLLQKDFSGPVVHLWNAANGQLRWSHDAQGQVTGASFTPDGKEVSLRGTGAAPRLLRIEDGTVARKFENQFTYISTLRPDGKAVVGGQRNGIIVGFDLEADREVFQFRTDGQEIRRIVFTAAGKRFVSVAVLSDGRQAIRLWDAQTGAPVQSLLGGSGAVNDTSVHPLSGELVVCGPETRVWSLGGARWTLRRAGNRLISSLAFWAADDVAYAPSKDTKPALLRLEGSSPATLWRPSKGYFDLTDVSADGRFAALGQFRQKIPILLLRRNGEAVEQVGAFTPSYHLYDLRISPSGGHLAAMFTGRNFVELFDTATGTQPVKLEHPELKRFNDLRWLSEEHVLGLVTVKDLRGSPEAEEQVVVMDAASGEILRRATHPNAMDVLAVSRDGRRFAEAGADENVRIRDTATLAVLKEFRVHDGPITALAWHPKKPILATGSADLTIRLWNLETGERIDEFRGPIAAPHTLAFSPSGQRLGCASMDATSRIWDPPSLRDETAPPLKADEGVMDEHAWFANTLPIAPPSAPVNLKSDAGGWTDLLASLTPERVAKTGHGWHLGQGELLSPAARYATVPLPGDLSGTGYQVHVKLRRIKGGAVFHVVLPVGDRMTGFELDGSSPGGGTVTSLILVNGKYGTEVPGFVDGRQINDNEPHDLEMTVYPDGANATISVALDAKPLCEWTGPASALSQASGWAQVTQPGFLALGTMNNVWAVSAVKVRRLADRTGSDR